MAAVGTGGADRGLEVSGVSKRYPGQLALDRVDLDVRAGEIHALVGQNGSGKSTLIKVLAGYHHPEGGARARLAGTPFALGTPGAARAAGMRFIHQDLGLVGDLTVAENLLLDERNRRWCTDRGDVRRAGRLLSALGLDLDPRRPVRTLSIAEQTLVAVARAMREGIEHVRLLVLDEPTSALPEQEAGRLFALLRRLRDHGAGVLYVTHRLPEVFALADRVTVLRDGRRVATRDVAGLGEPQLIELIAGRPLEDLYPEPVEPGTDAVLEVEALRGASLTDLSFAAHRGEIVGMAGLTGSGREAVAGLVAGAIPWESGRIRVEGAAYARMDPRAAIAAGLAYVPSDRRALSANPALTVRENVTLPAPPVGRGGWLGLRAERAEVAAWLERLDVRPREPERVFATLSGGNQQRAVLARWLRCGSRVFLVDEPTQGVDVAGKADIYASLAAAARDGAAVVLASSDEEELASVCERVLVLQAGRICAELSGPGLSAHAIIHSTLASR